MEDEKRKNFTLWEAAEYLDLTPGKVQYLVERGVLKADKFAGAIHIPREEVGHRARRPPRKTRTSAMRGMFRRRDIFTPARTSWY